MSSLKDWYRYVDSRARTRSGSEAPAAREREAPAGAPGGSEPDERPAEAEAPTPDLAGADEEGLDVWSGLFSPPRKPDAKPTTAPLKRPAARLDEVPADLPFTRTPIESPPAPQFPRPEAEVAIPRFDEFVSPFVPEPSPPLVAPAASAGPPAANGEAAAPVSEPRGMTEEAPLPPASAPGQSVSPSAAVAPERAVDSGPASAAPAEAALSTDRVEADGFGPAVPAVASSEADAVAPGTEAPVSLASDATASVPPEARHVPLESAAPPPALADAEDQPADEDGQVPWRSPFPRPGPGRTVSSGAPSPRPEPLVPRTAAAQPPAETDAGTVPVLGRSPARPAPGTTEWERERVDRLARTFRETLRALEESLAGPQAAASPAPAATEPERPAAAPAAPPSAGPGQPVSAPPRRRRLDEVLQSLETRMPPATPAPAASAAPAPGALLANATADLVAPPAGATGAAEEVDAAAVSPEPAGTIIAAAPPAEAPPFERSTLPDQERVVIPTPAFEIPAGMLDEAPARSLETRPEAAAARVEVIPNTPAIVAVSPVEPAPTAEARLAPVAPPPVAPSPRLPVPTAAPPDVRRNIEEAALMRQRLPQHIDMLLRIPTNEVAQNSYKSPFRETREELIRRLLDPQLTLEEAARVLGVCPTTVRRYTNRGMLHCHRTPGNQRRFRMSDVLQFVEQYGDRIDRAAEARAFEEAA